MLSRLARLSLRASTPRCTSAALRLLPSSRAFSSGSHDDFAPQQRLAPQAAYEEVEPKLRELVGNNRVVLFMKGSPTAPQCGFSRTVARILSESGVKDYTFVDVLKSGAVREGIKKFSDWPTIPQLYIDGEFVGGCDIVTQMYKEGELASLVDEKGLNKPEQD